MNAPPPAQAPQESNLKIPESVTNGINAVSDTVSAAGDRISDASDYVKSSIGEFSNQGGLMGAGSDFLQANTLVAKFAFIIMVLIAFLFLFNLGVLLIGYFTKPKDNPILISGTMNAANEVIIYQDPNNTNSIPILRSNNQNTGIEFSWSIWIFVNDISPPSKPPRYSNIFNKGTGVYDDNGLATVNNGPGLYLDNTQQQLLVAMNTVSSTNPTEYMYIKDVPLRKWFQCTIRLENTLLDVYINGTIVGRLIMQDVPKQNYENVNVCRNGGFNGNIADLRYYDHALSVFEINNIVVWGRNTSASSAAGASDATGFPYYLSNLWYSSNY